MPKKEIKVPNFPRIYKIVEVGSDGVLRPTGQYRVRRRFQQHGRWTTHPETVDSFDKAKKIARQTFVPQTMVASNSLKMTFKDAFAKFMQHKEFEMKLSRGTIAGYWNRYDHFKFFDPMPMQAINSKTLDTWIDLVLDPDYLKLQQGSRICYDHEFTLLVTFFRYHKNFIDESFVIPILDRHRKRACARSKSSRAEIRFLNSLEEIAFLEALSPWPVIQDIALFQLHTGARIGEAAAVEFHNLDFSRGEVRVVQHLHWERHRDGKIILQSGTKAGPTRNVPLTPECAAMLKRRQRIAKTSIAFESDSSSWLTYRSVQSIYDRAFRRLGLPHTGTHVMRHTFAVRYLDQTKDIYALKDLLGHTDLKVTQVYAKYSNESVRRSFQLFRGGLSGENQAHVPQLVPRRQT